VSPPRFSVRQVVLVNLLFVVLMLAGLLVAGRLPVDVFPDISFNSAIVTTIWPGASADEVERIVTRKIEDEIRDVPGIKTWFSFSSDSASAIEIEWDETLSKVEQQASVNDLRAAIDRVADLPEDAEETVLRELSVSEVFDICMITISDIGQVGEYTLREVARDLERKAERIPGVRKGRLMGARDRELRVYVDKERALQVDLTLAEISRLIQRNNQNIPGGTFSNDANQEISVRGLGNYVSPEALAATIVRKNPDGNHVTLGEIADVVPDFERRSMYGYYNGSPTIAIGIAKTRGADISDVVSAIREMVEREGPHLPEGLRAEVVWDASVFVQKRMSILRNNLILGVCFVVVVLWLTIGFRNSLLAIVGVPFSFLVALLLFPFFGLTINMLSLVGFVMVSGMLVDDAIIVIENIYRHVESGEPPVDAVIAGTEEVMWPVIAAICTTMAAFIPMLLVTGTSGQFMSILPKTVIACLLASLLECLFILPAHYLDWGSKSSTKSASVSAPKRLAISSWSYAMRARVDDCIDTLRDAYLRALDRVLEHRLPFIAACLAAFFFSCGLSSHVRTDLFPSDFNQLFVTLQTPVDSTLDQTNEIVLRAARALEPLADEIPEVSTYVGFGMAADERPLYGSNYGTLYVGFRDSPENVAEPGRMVRLVREVLEEHRREHPDDLEELVVVPPRNGPPIGKPVAVRVVTDDYDLAKQIAMQIKLELATLAGVYNIEDNVPFGRRELRIGLDDYRASLHGLSFDDVGVALRAANDGLVSSTFKDPHSDEDVDIRVLLREDQRTSAAELVDVEVRTPDHYTVKIGDVGTIGLTRGYQRLYHYDAQRAVVVYADVDGRAATSVSVNRHLQARFADVPLQHPEVELVFGGEFQDTNRAFEDMQRAFIVALIAIYAILAAQFRSYLQPLVVMCVIVFAYIGVVIGMVLFDYAISMYVLYAIVGLAGVVVNDSLVLIDFVNKERERGTPIMDAIRLAGQRRFRAVMLTTLTTVAGLLPMALGLSGVSTVFGPFAAAIVAGLSLASLLTLFVVPTLYVSLEQFAILIRRQRGQARLDAGVSVTS